MNYSVVWKDRENDRFSEYNILSTVLISKLISNRLLLHTANLS